ncbi:MAG TPA: HIT family protein [Candidatus Acidoferrum sp.]|nr:HIT family protein [Candidatus Acidoferrum sp.]
MASIFTRIIRGELPARFVWQDKLCVAFLSNRPLRPGHTLVVPRAEVDHWLDAEPELLGHVMQTAQVIGKAQMVAFRPNRIGMMIAGLEVPHLHVHVVPIRGVHDLDFSNQDASPDPDAMDRAAASIRLELRALGFTEAAGPD